VTDKRKPYSVLLRYPEEWSNGLETFYGFTRARNPGHAVDLVRRQAVRHLTHQPDLAEYKREIALEFDAELALEFEVELVLRGHHRGLVWE
jgi:hypothetical protein